MSATKRRAVGLATIALAIGFNVSYAMLATTYDYPAVLRRPAAEALAMFAAGGPGLILTWYAFLLSALALIVLAPAISVTSSRLDSRPALAVGAAITGALAGLAQAIGLSRWVFVAPTLTADDPRAAEQAFDLLNAWGGVAIGEHIGQLLTAVFALQLAWLQKSERRRLAAGLGGLAGLLLLTGTGEGVALSLGQAGDMFSLATIAGFLSLTLWLILTGAGLQRRPTVQG